MSQIIGHGSQFEIDTTASATGIAGDTWTSVAGVTSIDFGSNKIETVDNTDMGTAGVVRTFISGLEDPGDVSLKINVKPGDTTQLALETAKDAGGVYYFKAIYPRAVKTTTFQGIITSIDESIPDDKLPTLSVKIKVTGAKTIS